MLGCFVPFPTVQHCIHQQQRTPNSRFVSRSGNPQGWAQQIEKGR